MTRRFLLLCQFFVLILICRAGGQPVWQYLNGPSGPVSSATLMADSSGTLFFMSDNDRIFHSTDDGRNWSWEPGSYRPANTSGIDRGVIVDNVMYVATSDSLVKSTDRGRSWTEVPFGNTDFEYQISREPLLRYGDSSILMVLYSGFADVFQLAIYNAISGVWQEIPGSHELNSSTWVASALSPDGTIYIASWKLDRYGISWTSDLGRSWKSFGFDDQNDLMGTPQPGSPPQYYSMIAQGNGYLLTGLFQHYNGLGSPGKFFGGFFESRDKGSNWNQNGIPVTVSDGMVAYATAVDSSGSVFVAQRDVVYRSTDRGGSWETKQIGGMVPLTMFVAPDKTIFLASSSLGIVRSSDGGATWEVTDAGIDNSTPELLIPDWKGSIVAQLNFGGVRRSADGGATWNASATPFRWTPAAMFAAPSSQLYIAAARPDSGLYQSSDGVNWRPVYGSRAMRFLSAVLIGDSTILAGTATGLERSTNLGEKWEHLAFDQPVSAILRHPSGVLVALVGSQPFRKIFYSSTDGAIWVEASNIAPGDVIQSIVLASDGTMYARDTGLYRSTNAGRNWSRIPVPYNLQHAGIGTGAAGDLLVTLALVDGNGFDLYRVTERGTRWSRFDDGLDRAAVWTIAADSSGYLYAGTVGHGIARTTKAYPPPISGGIEHVIKLASVALHLIPNPARGLIRVEISLLERQEVVLAVFDPLGRRVATLYDGNMERGTSLVTWNTENVLPGNYQMVLSGNGHRLGGDRVVVVR